MKYKRNAEDKPTNSNNPSPWRVLIAKLFVRLLYIALMYAVKVGVIACFTYFDILVQSF